MSNLKKLIENLEKLSGKKVVLKESHSFQMEVIRDGKPVEATVKYDVSYGEPEFLSIADSQGNDLDSNLDVSDEEIDLIDQRIAEDMAEYKKGQSEAAAESRMDSIRNNRDRDYGPRDIHD